MNFAANDMESRLHFALLAAAATPRDEPALMRGRILAYRTRYYSDAAIARMLEAVAAEGVSLYVERIGEDRLLCWTAPTFPPLLLLRALAHVTERLTGALEALGYAEA